MKDSQEPKVTADVIEGLARGLADKAKIDLDAAHRVLKTLHVDKLDENVRAFHAVMSDQKAVNALGLSHAHARENLAVASTDAIKIENLRMAIKPVSAASIAV